MPAMAHSHAHSQMACFQIHTRIYNMYVYGIFICESSLLCTYTYVTYLTAISKEMNECIYTKRLRCCMCEIASGKNERETGRV